MAALDRFSYTFAGSVRGVQTSVLMKVGEVAMRPVVTVTPEATLLDVATLMRAQHVGAVVVVEHQASGKVPVGILTDRDIVVGVVAQGVSDLASIFVKDTMPRGLVTAREDEDVFAVLERVREHGVRRIPVVNAVGDLTAIVTHDDLLAVFARSIHELSRNVREQRAAERSKRG